MDNKICPLMSGVFTEKSDDRPDVFFAECQEADCQLWSTVFTTEGIQISGCALEINAHKTQSGEYAV